jgi:ABC-type Fe3+/spermidine/putrescine transport system ATPase subunit
MRGKLRRMQRDLGIAFIHVTHTQPEAIALADLVVVMDHGHIEQAASAYDVYAKPLTAYVARFIGGQNVLGGRVSAVSNGMIVLDLPTHGRVEFAAADPAPPAGSTLHVSVRRDRIHLAKQKPVPQSCCCYAAREQEHPSPSAGRPIDAAPCQPASARATRPAKAANERSIRSRDSPLTMKTMRELWSSSGHSGK